MRQYKVKKVKETKLATKVKETKVKETKLATITCNKCGKKVKLKYNENDRVEFAKEAQYFTVNYQWQFGSKYDLECHKFDICEKCYKKFIGSFKVPVQIEEYELG